MADFNFVTSRVATGAGINDENDVKQLLDAGINVIIDCRGEYDDTALLASHPDVVYVYAGVPDDGQPKPTSWFEKPIEVALTQLAKPHTKVYAHCFIPGTMVGGYEPQPIESPPVSVFNGQGFPKYRVPHNRYYNGDMITVKAAGTLPITCTPNHKFMVLKPYTTSRGTRFKPNFNSKFDAFVQYKSKLEPQWICAADLEPGDCLLSPHIQYDHTNEVSLIKNGHKNSRDIIVPSDLAWLTGYFAGDGYASKVGVMLTMGKNDDYERAERSLASAGLPVQIEDYGEYKRVRANSVDLSRTFSEWCGKKTNKHIPEFVFANEQTMQEALQGALDADGSYSTNRRSWTFTNTSLQFCWQIWHIALTLGYKPYIRSYNRTTGYNNASPIWHVSWTIDGKHSRTFHWNNHYAMPIEKIDTSTYSGIVYNMEVSDTHDYIANGVWVSNCAAGVNRGPSMCYAILLAQGLDPNTAENLIRTHRPQVGIAYKQDAIKAVAELGYADNTYKSAFGEIEH